MKTTQSRVLTSIRFLIGLAVWLGASASQAAVYVIDNNTTGYTTTGSWGSQTFANAWDSYLSNWQYQNAGGGADTATWTFTGLPSGSYYIAAGTKYGGQGNLTVNALFTLSSGGGFSVNQQAGTKHFEDHHPTGQPAATKGPGFARLSTFNGYVPVSITGGTIAVTVSNAARANFLTADAIRMEPARADAQKIWVIGNGTTGYSESGSWSDWQGEFEHNYGFRFSSSGTATFAFTGLDSGLYRVSATWAAGANRPLQAEYAIPGIATNVVSQQAAPAGDNFEDVPWKDLFTNIVVTGGSMTVTLRGLSAGVAIADAVRVELTGLGSAPNIIQHPQGGIFTTGATATLTVVATNDPPSAYTYQWLKNGLTNSGATGASLVLSNLVFGDAGDYRAIVSNAGGSVTSIVATVTIVRAPATVRWNSTSSTVWDINTTANWLNQFTLLPDFFEPNDSVAFDDTIGLQTNVTIGTGVAVNPATVSVTSTNNHFSISGSGKITGGATLTKEGPSTLTLGTANDFTGAVNVNGGILKLAASTALGTTSGGTIVAPGATLDLNSQRIAGEPISLSGSGVGGNGALVNNGTTYTSAGVPQRVTLNGDATFGGTGNFELGRAVGTAFFNGNGYSITKTNPNWLWFVSLTVSNLADITVAGGKIGFDDAVGGMGDPARTLTLAPGAILATYSDDAVADTYTKNFVLNDATVQNEGGVGALTLAGAMTLSGTNTFWNSMTITAPIAGSGSLVKSGGTLTLTATNTYLGATRVMAGTLALAGGGSIANTSGIQIDSGASLVVTGRTDGTLALSAGQLLSGSGLVLGNVTDTTPGSLVSPGGDAIGTLTIGGSLSLSGSQLYFGITGVTNEGGTFNDLLVVTNLILSGSNAVIISPLTLLSGGTYTLIRYTGTLTGDPASLVPVSQSRYTFSITHDPVAQIILLHVSGSGGNLLWAGDGALNRWEQIGAANWLLGGSPAQFLPGDTVTFGETGSDSPAIDLVGALQPAGLMVSNAARHYTFGGAGYVAGGTSLIKDGPGTLTLVTPNTFTGGTTISNGVVEVGNGGTSGWLPGNVVNYGSVVFRRSDEITFAQALSGPGTLVQAGPGTLNINANYGVPVAVTGGTMALVGNFNRLQTSPLVTVGAGGMLICPTYAQNLNGLLTLNGGTLAGTGDGTYGSWLLVSNVIVNGGANGSIISAVNVTLRTVGGVTFDVQSGASSGVDLDVTGSINHLAANPDTGLIKAGPGVMRFSGVNTFYGGVRVDAGTLLVDGALAAVANTVTVAGGTLGGAGLIAGPVIVQSGGTLAPGASIGVLTVSNTLGLSGQTTMELNRTNVQNCDLVRGVSTFTFGGTLSIVNAGEPLQGGEVFNLFDATSFAGVFTATNLPALGTHLSWDLSNLGVDGTIAVLTNRLPVANNDTMGAVETIPVAVASLKFLSNDSDPDGDSMTITGVGVPGHGTAQLSLDGLTVTYTATGGYSGPDSFTYTVSDGWGGTAVATVNINVRLRSEIPPNIVAGPAITNGNFVVRFAGIPGTEYTVEASESLSPVSWLKVTNLFAPTNDVGLGIGIFQFSEPTGTNTQRYYRTAWPSY